MERAHIGTDFGGFLEEEGMLAESEEGSIQRVLAWQIDGSYGKQISAGEVITGDTSTLEDLSMLAKLATAED
jgi:hypothetical protein